MTPDRGGRPVPGPGQPRHARPAAPRRGPGPPRGGTGPRPPRAAWRRTASWLTAIIAVAAVGGAGVWLLRPKAAAGHPAPGHGSAAAPHSGGTPLSAARIGSSASSTPAPGAATVSVTDVGDMNFGTDGRYPAGGPATLFAGVAGDLHSDLTVGNLETALGSSGTTKCGASATDCYAFQAPADFAVAVRQAGFSAVNVANNHTDDAGPVGIQETDAALTVAHLSWTGRPAQLTYLVRNGVKIGLLGFAPYAYDRNLLDIPAAVAAVRLAAAHAQLVIVFIHAGAEGAGAQHVRPGMETYLGEERGDPIAFSHAVIRAGADLVLGSGPHVLRAMQWYRHRLIAYSLGNFAGYYTLGLDGVTADSAILHVRLRADGTFAGGSVTPIRLVGAGTPQPDPAGTGIALINSLSRSDLGTSGVHITASGQIEPP